MSDQATRPDPTLAGRYNAARRALDAIARGDVPFGTSSAEYAREALQDLPAPVDETFVCWHGEFTWDAAGQTQAKETVWKCRGCEGLFLSNDETGTKTPYSLTAVPEIGATDAAIEAAARALIDYVVTSDPEEEPEEYLTFDEMSDEDRARMLGLGRAALEAGVVVLRRAE